MLIEELLKCSVEALEKMSDEELLKHFQKYLNVTRPEQAKIDKPKPAVYVAPMTDKKKRVLAFLAAEGVDTDALLKHRHKKSR